MQFASILDSASQRAVSAVLHPSGAWIRLSTLDPAFGDDLLTFIDLSTRPAHAELSALVESAYVENGIEDVRFAPPYLDPPKIWGIGLNYLEHATDLEAIHPEVPASFIKGSHTILGPDGTIVLPRQSNRVTSEGELGLVIGRLCENVSEDCALDYVFGVCSILDQTAEDILQLNPRYLTRAKNFPTFFAFGPTITTLDEATASVELSEWEVCTWLNGERIRCNVVGNMAHSPAQLVSFHSQMMPLLPGDIISTGTPGAVRIRDGDVVKASVGDLPPLRATVEALNGTAP